MGWMAGPGVSTCVLLGTWCRAARRKVVGSIWGKSMIIDGGASPKGHVRL